MKPRLLLAASAVASFLVAPAAGADDRSLYLGAGAGLNFLNDLDLSAGGEVDADLGWAAIGTVGYRFGNGLRTELEGGYRFNDGDIAGVSANTETFSGMANLLYDWDLDLIVEPYLGAGVGAVNSEMANDSEWAFAYQGIAGLSVEFNQWVEAFVDYRFLGTIGYEDADPLGNELDDELMNHTILAGVRFTVWNARQQAEQPAPEPTPAPEPAPTARCGNYVVFFEFNSADLTPEAAEIVRQAAATAGQAGSCKITVTGHTDRSGSPAYNERLSQRRAQNVAAALVREGVAEGDIVVQWGGEAAPSLPTEDGVRETQNRRVTIDMI
jgi:outer membrane protein OmpA-like peptidoglycan-associated protein